MMDGPSLAGDSRYQQVGSSLARPGLAAHHLLAWHDLIEGHQSLPGRHRAGAACSTAQWPAAPPMPAPPALAVAATHCVLITGVHTPPPESDSCSWPALVVSKTSHTAFPHALPPPAAFPPAAALACRRDRLAIPAPRCRWGPWAAAPSPPWCAPGTGKLVKRWQ